jgi:protein-S-isoprenylcysteine O-methyltransferase Ste14
MPLREEFETSGNWLFIRRSWLPVLLYPFAIAILYFYPDTTHHCITTESWGLICFGVSLLGLVVRALTVGFTPKGTSGRNTGEGQVAETLNQTGIYSVVRHPLYLGNFLMWLGLFMYIGLWWFVLICALAYWLYYERIMYAEEEFLRRSYSTRYEAWASRTPAFLPRLSGWQPSNLDFSFRNVLKREYNGMFATVISFVLINMTSHYFTSGRLHLDLLWQVIGGIGAVLFLVLRTLKKHTRVLDIDGR